MSGPPRKKDSERRRRNNDGVETQVINVDELLQGEVEIPVPPAYFDGHKDECHDDCQKHLDEWVCSWHPIAEKAYWSLASSGQVIFMEPSDWMTAYTLCEALSRELKPKPIVIQTGEGETEIQWVTQPINGAVLNGFLKGWGSMLMAAEGSRRTLRIELERRKRIDAAAGDDGKVVDIVKRREDAFKGATG